MRKRLDPMAWHVNNDWGHAEAKPDRTGFQNEDSRAIHRGYIRFFMRRGVRPPPVDCCTFETDPLRQAATRQACA